jgi:hypothetical protein
VLSNVVRPDHLTLHGAQPPYQLEVGRQEQPRKGFSSAILLCVFNLDHNISQILKLYFPSSKPVLSRKINMSATMAIESCPENENSTDCLLRVLLGVIDTQFNAEDSKFDWDPITFAFTVPIGILALFFTIFLFFQAALASGPGRRKSNGRTIGKWASKTRREWNWQDLNVVSIARTPVLRTKNLGDILNKNKSPEKNGATPKTAEKTIRPQSSQESENAETTATTGQTWARLFPSRWKTAILPSRQRNVEAAAATVGSGREIPFLF